MFSEEPHFFRLRLGVAIVLVAVLFLSFASAIVWSFHARFPTIQIIFIQNFVSLLCILPLSFRAGIGSLKTENLSIHLARDLFGVASYFFFFLAIRYLNLVNATLLNYTAPLWVPFLWRLRYKEPIQTNVWWSIIIGFIGMAIILNPTKQIFALGFFFGLFAGFFSAIASVALRMLNLKQEPMNRSLFYYFSIGSILSLPFAIGAWVAPTFGEVVKAIGIGVFTAAGQMLLTIAYRYGTAAQLSPVGYASIIYSGLISCFLFGQCFDWQSILGTILIISGGVLTYFFERKN
jgi:drug/metabolite transporter (DMT)-like permease